MPVHRKKVNESLTIFSGEGEVSFAEVMAALESFYSAEPTLNIIWDLRQGTAAKMSYDELMEIVGYLAKISGARRGGKSALVSPLDVDYGIFRMLDTLAEVEEFQFFIQVFRDYDEAIKWLES